MIKYTESYKACIVRTVKKNKAITLRNVGLREESDAQLKAQVMAEMKDWNIEEEVVLEAGSDD